MITIATALSKRTMLSVRCAGVLAVVLLLAVAGSAQDNKDKWRRLVDTKARDLKKLEDTVGLLSRQLLMQQFYVEEQTRGNGDSGLKMVRNDRHGTRPYHASSHVDSRIAAIHNHANTVNTIGMGEFTAVLNGIEFRTRHNDYKLAMKSTTSGDYGATEDIPPPSVPPEVLQNVALEDQIAEMKEWFKAWADQDYSVRDYRPYFKPVLCYMEGQWTHSDQSTIDESFDSDRHHLDASSWLDLQEKIRFTSYSGTKDGLENFAYLPSTIFSIINETIPVLAQWNFQILCHPLSRDVPLSRLRVVDDLKARISLGQTQDQHLMSRAARFQLSPDDSDSWEDKREFYTLVDEFMSEIPGRDNYQADIEDDIMGDTIYPFDTRKNEPLNVGYYHRSYRLKEAGAMGLKTRRRGFSDQNLFLAQTTQSKVAGLPIQKCNRKGEDCEEWFQRWSYAIPLEMVYMTPLTNWNPYDLVYKGDAKKKEGKRIYIGPNGKRNGGASLDKAYNGTNSKNFYTTPLEFFEDELDFDPADTTQDYTNVLDSGNNIRRVRASGYRIFLPEIPGIGTLRQRYPIMPIHGQGSSVWKELEALKDLVLHPSKYKHMFHEEVPVTTSPDGQCVNINNMCGSDNTGGGSTGEEGAGAGPEPQQNVTTQLHFTLQPADSEHGSHTHHVELSPVETERYLAGERIDVITEEEYGHRHQLNIARVKRGDKFIDLARRCDGQMWCWDGHHRRLEPTTD